LADGYRSVDGCPTSREVTAILAAVEELLTEHGPMTEEHLLVALHDAGVDLGRDPVETLNELLDGEPLVEIFPDLDGLADRGMPVNAIQDAPAFLLPPDRLWTLGLRAGDLVGFRTRSATAGAPGS